jgi:hypothetical protein
VTTLKHDKQGFLVGELLSGQKELLEYQQTGLNYWKSINSNVRAIARAVGARSTNSRVAEPAGRAYTPSAGGTRSGRSTVQPRDSSGRFVVGTRAVAPQRSRNESGGGTARSTQAATTAAAAAAAKAAVASRDNRGRFQGSGRRGGRPGGGGGADDGDAGPGFGSALAERLSGIKNALQGVAHGAEQVDPALAAANEVKEVVAPFGRGVMALVGRTSEKKKERWYQRIINAITGKKKDDPDKGGKGGAGGGGLSFGGIGGGLLTGLVSMLGVGLAGFIGTKIGGAIYDWLDKSGIATKIFDLFDAAVDWIKGKVAQAKAIYNDFDSSRQLARAGIGGSAPVFDASGRNVNDPRRLDMPGADDSLAAKAGRIIGSYQRGSDGASVDAKRTAVENRALTVGNKWSQGNIAGLSDQQTRALVASTVATESKGGLRGW